jgi:UDP-N-acetylglucosamine acyltransferase
VNAIGLRRRGFSEAAIDALGKAHRLLFHSGLLREEGLERAQAELGGIPEVDYLLAFIRDSKRGVHRG